MNDITFQKWALESGLGFPPTSSLFVEAQRIEQSKKEAAESIKRLHAVEDETKDMIQHLGADTYAERDI